jgi:putative intracellular protease/amidase
MSGTIDVLNPDRPKRVLVLASNPAVSEQTGWPIGFWWGELTHPYWEFVERGYEVEVVSPDGGPLKADSWSDPRDRSGYSSDDLISLGFINSREPMKLVEESKPLPGLDLAPYDALLAIGGQGPMYTFYDNDGVHGVIRNFYEAGKPTAVICHGTCALLRTRLSDGSLLVEGKTWTGSQTRRRISSISSWGSGSSRSGLRKKRGSSTVRTSSCPGASGHMRSGTALSSRASNSTRERRPRVS